MYLFDFSFHLKYRSGVYAILNVADGMRYVGSSKDMMRRADQHFKQLLSGTHPNARLQEAFDLYGAAVFSVVTLEICEDWLLPVREQVWINRMDARLYNVERKVHRGYLDRWLQSRKNRRII